MSLLIEVKNLVKNFRTGNEPVTFVLRGINLEVKEGEFLIIEGVSGSGKTTLLNMLAGLDKFDSGVINFAGQSLRNLSEQEIEKYRRHDIGIVFQDFNLISSLSAWENVALPLRFSGIGRGERKKRAIELLTIVGLCDQAKHLPYALSGGEQQRVAIARALVSNPKIILADEPTGNLDTVSGAIIMNLFKELNSKYGRTVLLVTHNPLYSGYGKRILTMQDGKIVASKKLAPVGLKKESENTQSAEYKIGDFNLPDFKRRMRLWDILGLSIQHFNYAKIRAFLTVLGMAISVCAITLFVSLGFGLQKLTVSSLASFEDLQKLTVTVPTGSNKNIDTSSVSAISGIANVEKISPSEESDAVATLGNINASVTVRGIYPDNLNLEGITLASGENFSSADAKEAIISKTALSSLSLSDADQSQIIGKNVMIQLPIAQNGNIINLNDGTTTVNLKVIGIVSETPGVEIDVPIGLLQKETGNENYSSLIIQVSDLKKTLEVRTVLEGMGFEVTGIFGLINQINKAFAVIELVLGLIGGIALLVASFGIINTMTISLLERTREIGVMKALGISRKDIKRLFAYESCYFGFFGGLIGLSVGFILGQVINSFVAMIVKQGGPTGNLVLFITPYWFMGLLLLFAILIARIAGIYPSLVANRKSPLESLKYE